MAFYVYLLASKRDGTLYIGMTDDLVRRIYEHREAGIPGFTNKYGVKMLVWFEEYGSREDAFRRERQMKKWNRKWKLQLIEASNPEWRDLAPTRCLRSDPSACPPRDAVTLTPGSPLSRG